MNHLNSVLIEGTIVGSPRVVKEQGDEVQECVITLISLRHLRGSETQETAVMVVFRGVKQAESAVKNACPGRRVRVVGRLAEGRDGLCGLLIEAEHIEYRS
jgi:single-stranded DNA-binding protein